MLACLSLMVVLVAYMCLMWLVGYVCALIWCTMTTHLQGLSASELQKLPRITGKQLGMWTECAVCLDDIEDDQPARLVPGCNHGFHVACADNWLSKHPVCPVCRAKVVPQLVASPSPC